MGMVVRTNTMALNAYRQLGMNNNAVAKSLEKLSSGFRINRAGDDAAGLAISEKMKAQITGLETASANAQDGISLIQTAEGNLSEVHDMLNRMVELATKSANGTYTSQERQALQDEADALLEEIDRISQSANFNGTRLLDGSMGLNSNAFTIGDATAATTAETKVGAAIGTDALTATHSNPEVTQAEAKPKFSINLADFTVTQTADTKAKGTATVTFKIGNNNVMFVQDAATSAASGDAKTVTIEAADKDTDMKVTGAGIVTAMDLGTTIKHAVIGKEVFSVEADGGNGLTFTWVGKVGTGDKLDTTAAVDEDTVKVLLTGDVAVTATKATGDNAIATENRDNCHLTKITDAKIESAVERAGASLKLTKDMIQVGAKLTIGDKEFTFVDEKEPATGADAKKIYIKDVAESDLLAAVTRQLSNKGTLSISKNDTDYTFTIGRGNGLDTIEIEEAVQTNASDYGAFTEDELFAAFSYTTAASNANTVLNITSNSSLANGDAININGTTYTFVTGTADASKNEVKIGATAKDTLNNLVARFDTTKMTGTVDNGKLTIKMVDAKADAPAIIGGGLTLQIGDTAETFNKMTVAVANMSAKGLGLEGLKKDGIMTEAKASDAIDTIKKAINSVSTARASMGALQNRLEHTINNLDVAAENLSSANSRIRDTDMAKEMMNYTKMNVLVQSAQAMLAQANQQPQSVLQLLQ